MLFWVGPNGLFLYFVWECWILTVYNSLLNRPTAGFQTSSQGRPAAYCIPQCPWPGFFCSLQQPQC